MSKCCSEELIVKVTGKLKMACLRYSGIDAVFIDYMQLIRSTKYTGEQRYQELTNMTQLLKSAARELGISIIAVAQLSKESIKSGGVAKIENLAGAYNMVSDADVGMTIKKVTDNVNSVTQGNAEINIDKLRFNQVDVLIPIYYNSVNLRMRELNAELT